MSLLVSDIALFLQRTEEMDLSRGRENSGLTTMSYGRGIQERQPIILHGELKHNMLGDFTSPLSSIHSI